jgi:hypothetical protein
LDCTAGAAGAAGVLDGVPPQQLPAGISVVKPQLEQPQVGAIEVHELQLLVPQLLQPLVQPQLLQPLVQPQLLQPPQQLYAQQPQQRRRPHA